MTSKNRKHLLFGIILISIAMIFGAATSTLAKLATTLQHHPIDVLFYRSLIPLIGLIVWMAATKKLHLIRTDRPKMQAIRAVVGTFNMLCTFWAYSLLPMAEGSSITFTAPLMIVLLSPFFLGEKPDMGRLLTAFIGLSGVILILSPSGNSTLSILGILMAFGAAGTRVVNDLLLRRLGSSDSVVTTSFWLLVVSTCVMGAAMPWVAHAPTMDTLKLMLLCGVFGGIAQLCNVQSYRMAEASLLTIFTYTSIFWLTLFGWLVFDDFPTMKSLAGMTLIVGVGVFILWKELSKKHHPDSPDS